MKNILNNLLWEKEKSQRIRQNQNTENANSAEDITRILEDENKLTGFISTLWSLHTTWEKVYFEKDIKDLINFLKNIKEVKSNTRSYTWEYISERFEDVLKSKSMDDVKYITSALWLQKIAINFIEYEKWNKFFCPVAPLEMNMKKTEISDTELVLRIHEAKNLTELADFLRENLEDIWWENIENISDNIFVPRKLETLPNLYGLKDKVKSLHEKRAY